MTVRKHGNVWCVYSLDGKVLGCYYTKEQAEKRLAQIEMFKHIKEDKNG